LACAALFVNHNGLLRNCFQIDRAEPAPPSELSPCTDDPIDAA